MTILEMLSPRCALLRNSSILKTASNSFRYSNGIFFHRNVHSGKKGLRAIQTSYDRKQTEIQRPHSYKKSFDFRSELKNARRVVVKLGSAVITREDGTGLALGRLASIVEQVSQFQLQGKEMLMVSSGAVAFGKQKLRAELRMSMSMRETLSLKETGGGFQPGTARSAAAVGQSGLMALYDAMFSQYGVNIAQVLVTKPDLSNPDTRVNLQRTISELLDLNIIPIINTNDAVISPGTLDTMEDSPNQVCDDTIMIHDNDSLAARLAVEVDADLLILMSDVDGVYNLPPWEEGARLINTYSPKRNGVLTYGQKSKVGLGGMESKVKSAVWAQERGVSVIICNAEEDQAVNKVIHGKKIETFFTDMKYQADTVETYASNGFTHARNKSADPFKSTFHPTTNRLQRNQAEKNRRERYNGFIKQLSSELPIAQASGRRMDKMSILRLTAAYLRVNQKIVKQPFMLLNWKSDAMEDPFVNSCLSELVDSLDGFFFFTDFTGNILFAAPTCAKYLGHHYTEILGVNVQKYLHPTDVPIFEEYLRGATEQILNGESTPAIFSTRCRMRIRNQPRSETVHYQTVNFHGSVTVGDDPQKVREDGKKTGESEDQKQKKQIKKSVLFFGLVQIIHPNPWDLSLTEATDNEYRSRLTLDGVMLEADHRISLIIGFTPMEVFGKSAYDFIHQDDLQISLFAHKQMLKNSNGTGIIVHRLVTASGGFVYLQSAGKMEYDAVTNKVFHFVCCSKLLVDEEGKEERNRFVSKFTPHIRKTTPIGLFESLTVDISQDFTDVIYKHSSRHLHSPAETPVTVTEVTYTRDYPEVPSATMQSLDMMMETIQTPDSGYAERIDEPNQANLSFSAESLSPQLQGAFPFLKQLKDYCANENGSKLPPRNTWTKFSYSIRAMTNYNGNGMPMTGAVFFECTDKRRDGNTQAQKRNPGSNSENPEPPPVNMAFWEGLETKVMGRFRNCTEVTPTTSKNEAKRKKYMENVPNTGMCNVSDFASSSPTAASTHTITSRDLPLDVNGFNGTLSAYSSNESLLKYDTAQQVINNENSYKNTNSYHQANSNNNNGFSSGTMYIDYSTFALPEESLSTAASGALLTDPNNGLTLSLPLFHADAGGSVVEKPFFTSTSTSPLQQSGTQMSMSGFEDFVAFPELCLDMGRTES